MTRASATSAVVALGATVLFACGGPRGDAERAVRAYNRALAAAYASSDASRMKDVATRKEADRVLVLVDLKTSNKLVLESTIEEFEVASTALVGENAATVETRERWRYRDRAREPGAAPKPTFVARMAMNYTVVREAGAWKVAEVKTLSNEYLEPKGFRDGK